MSPTIRIDDEVFAFLQQKAEPFTDTPNSVLRQLLGLSKEPTPKPTGRRRSENVRGRKTPQGDFRLPILSVLLSQGGHADRQVVLREVERKVRAKLTSFDREDIKSGSVRWQKSAEWEVRVMREEGLLKPVHETDRGVWGLTPKGWETAKQSLP